MKNFKKTMLPLVAITTLGIVALSAPIGATVVNNFSLTSDPSGTVFVAVLPLTKLSSTASLARLIIGINQKHELTYENGPRGSVAPQLQASTLD